MRHTAYKKPVSVSIYANGRQVRGQDVFRDGTKSCLTPCLGEYESPEHAEVVAYILNDPQARLLLLTGRINQQVVDVAAASLREQRAAGGDNQKDQK